MTKGLNMKRQVGILSVMLFAVGATTVAQESSSTNSIGMELVLIKPGSMIVGKFEPPYAKPPDPNAPPARGPAAGRGGAGTTLAPVMMTLADRNKDQKLTKDELLVLVDGWFDKLDSERAGRLNQQDFGQRFATLVTPPQPGAGAPGAEAGTPGGGPPAGRGGGRGGVGPGLFSAGDVNKDGFLTREEFKAAFDKWFSDWDTAKSGTLTQDQLAAGLNAALPQQGGGGRALQLTAAEYKRIEEMAKADYSPGFAVQINRPFYIGKYEVTQAQWKKVTGSNPSLFQGDKVTDDADRHPVENVTWEDAQAFVKKLNSLEKTRAYRLPTEFEWEYAARAGGDADTPWARIRDEGITGYNSYTSTHMVGEKKPNAWGLYDTLGNVWEWVQDYYNEKIFADPIPPKNGKVHVLKGGGFVADVKNSIPATHAAGPGSRFDVGLRIVRDVK